MSMPSLFNLPDCLMLSLLLVLIGSYGVFPLATILCVCTIAITAGYILWRLGSVFFGPLMENWATLGDARRK